MRIGSYQANVVFGDPAANALNAVEKIRWAAGQGIELLVFPECYLTGYCVDSAEQAAEIAIEANHDAIAMIADCVRETHVSVVIGFVGKQGDEIYNGAIVLAPEARPYVYRKCHLPALGVDNFCIPGRELKVLDMKSREGPYKLGVLICFDQRLPEPARVLALQGADIIALPTNWPEKAENSAEIMCIARASESRVFYATANRAGEENGFKFIGRSKIIDPVGKVLASADADETVIFADIDLAQARQKRTVNIPGKYEMEVFASRRPELYGELVKPIS